MRHLIRLYMDSQLPRCHLRLLAKQLMIEIRQLRRVSRRTKRSYVAGFPSTTELQLTTGSFTTDWRRKEWEPIRWSEGRDTSSTFAKSPPLSRPLTTKCIFNGLLAVSVYWDLNPFKVSRHACDTWFYLIVNATLQQVRRPSGDIQKWVMTIIMRGQGRVCSLRRFWTALSLCQCNRWQWEFPNIFRENRFFGSAH